MTGARPVWHTPRRYAKPNRPLKLSDDRNRGYLNSTAKRSQVAVPPGVAVCGRGLAAHYRAAGRDGPAGDPRFGHQPGAVDGAGSQTNQGRGGGGCDPVAARRQGFGQQGGVGGVTPLARAVVNRLDGGDRERHGGWGGRGDHPAAGAGAAEEAVVVFALLVAKAVVGPAVALEVGPAVGGVPGGGVVDLVGAAPVGPHAPRPAGPQAFGAGARAAGGIGTPGHDVGDARAVHQQDVAVARLGVEPAVSLHLLSGTAQIMTW